MIGRGGGRRSIAPTVLTQERAHTSSASVRLRSGREVTIINPGPRELRRLWLAALDGTGPRVHPVRVMVTSRAGWPDHAEQIDLAMIESFRGSK